jgi:hypothetical protein
MHVYKKLMSKKRTNEITTMSVLLYLIKKSCIFTHKMGRFLSHLKHSQSVLYQI